MSIIFYKPFYQLFPVDSASSTILDTHKLFIFVSDETNRHNNEKKK